MSYVLPVWMFLKLWLVSSLFPERSNVTLLFSIEQNRSIYELSIYGEPPQFGIWLEDPLTGEIRTAFVTYRTGHGDFEGKSSVPVALPAWIGAFQKETGRTDLPTPQKPVDMGVTGATQKIASISRGITVHYGSKWAYYVEVNVAGDYNPAFPSYQNDGTPDHDGNGQPSLIYSGVITAVPGTVSNPKLIGRTEQLYISTSINSDLEGIGNAQKLFKNIEVSCKP